MPKIKPKIKTQKHSTYLYGIKQEKIAEIFLKIKGYKIIANRYKNPFGEIDIIARKGKTLVFVEVKARKNNELIETILRTKQVQRIKNSAEIFLANNDFSECDIRFDLILFSKTKIPIHYKNYF